MAELKLILKTYMQFYRRHVGLLLLFFIGFSLGAALLTAIQGLNLEAGKRYQQTTALIANPVTHFIRPVLGENRLPNSMWSRIRAAGFTQVQPVLEGVIETDKQQKLALRGVNLLQWLTQNTDSSAPASTANNSYSGFEQLLNTVYIDPKLMQRLNLKNSRINIKMGDATRTLTVSELQGLGMTMLVDISLADKLLRANGVISYFEVSGLNSKQAAKLNALLGEQARLEAAQEQAFDALSEAFFFNLQALAFLGYVVGAFLSFNAIKLAYNARAHLQQQMWVLGCQRSALIKALAIELTLLSFFAAVLGAILGAALANALVMDVSATLRGLYQLDRSFVVNLDSSMVAS
ncbi:MAG: ABC transporter permease, partial [Pseudoalteromonas marina]